MKQVAAQPNWLMDSATTTVRLAVGPLTCRAEPPSNPATTPPTTTAINPAATGAPVATAMPMDRGSETRNTTIDAGRS